MISLLILIVPAQVCKRVILGRGLGRYGYPLSQASNAGVFLANIFAKASSVIMPTFSHVMRHQEKRTELDQSLYGFGSIWD